jgi:hypothetical protein
MNAMVAAFNCCRLRPFCEQVVESCGRGPDSGWSMERWQKFLDTCTMEQLEMLDEMLQDLVIPEDEEDQ